MKLNELRKLIKEELDTVMQEEKHEPIDEVGKFFVVMKPSKGAKKEDIMKESTVFEEILPENTLGVYTQKSDASRHATEAIKEYETKLDELKASMEEFRKTKKDIDDKKSKAKDLISKLK